MQTIDISTLEALRECASQILKRCTLREFACVIALTGELGAGKTALTKELALLLGVRDDVTSPTFVIMKSYPILIHRHFHTLVHIDAYRVESEDEMRVLGYADILKNSGYLVCIEWPERIPHLIPQDALRVHITLQGTTRTVTYGN